MAKNNEQDNIFINSKTYPQPQFIFSFSLKPIEEIKDDCLVVLDTNALLVPYTVSKASIEQIRNTYNKLINENRLVVPGQVAREFAKNRPNKLVDLYQQLSDKRDQMKLPKKEVKYPLLESIEAYQKWEKLGKELHEVATQYREATSEILKYIEKWHWNDPVSSLYAELFKENTIVEFEVKDKSEEAELKLQLNECNNHKLPPGYKDSTKDNEGIGDLLIWKTILEVGGKHHKSIIFVSGEEKADWWYRSKGKALYPRYELVDEFRRVSKGQSFHILELDKFLNLYGADKEAIQEVKKAVNLTRVKPDFIKPNQRAKKAVANYLEKEGYQVKDGYRPGLELDFIAQKNIEEIGIIVEYNYSSNFADLLSRIEEDIQYMEIRDIRESNFLSSFLIFSVSPTSNNADRVKIILERHLETTDLELVEVGYLDKNNNFHSV